MLIAFLIFILCITLVRAYLKPIFKALFSANLFVADFLFSHLIFSFISAELLSLFDAYNQTGLIILYAIFGLAQLYFIWQKRHELKFIPIKINLVQGFILVVLLFLFFLAVYMPPNNWDSLSYHLPKIEHWRQNSNVYPYPSFDDRQNSYSPLSEYLIAIWQIILGKDYLSNLFQWFSLVAILGILREIFNHLKVKKWSRYLGYLFFLSHPLITFESTTTQNDLVVVFMFALFFITTIKLNARPLIDFYDFVLLASIISFGALLKYNLLIYELPIVLYFLYNIFKHKQIGLNRFLFFALISGVIFASINAPFLGRNYLYFHNLLGEPYLSNQISNEIKNFETLFSNVLKNFGDHFYTPFSFINHFIFDTITRIHAIFTIDVNSDARNFMGEKFQAFYYFHEDNSSSIFHIFLFTILIPCVFFINNQLLRAIICFIFVGFFSYSLIFRWQFFGIRLELPLFFLAVIYVVIVSGRFAKPVVVLLTIISGVLILPPILFNPNKPVINSQAFRLILNKPKGLLSSKDWAKFSEMEQAQLLTYYSFGLDSNYIIKKNLDETGRRNCIEFQKSINFYDRILVNIFSNSRWQNYFIQDSRIGLMIESSFEGKNLSNNPRILLKTVPKAWEYPYFVFLKEKVQSDHFYLGTSLKKAQIFERNHPGKAFYTMELPN